MKKEGQKRRDVKGGTEGEKRKKGAMRGGRREGAKGEEGEKKKKSGLTIKVEYSKKVKP